MQIVLPRRVSRCFTQRLVRPVPEVFPLLCPVRESDWIEDWDPRVVYSTSGFVEPGCVFVTPAEPTDAVWYVTRHDAEAAVVEMIKFSPGVTVSRVHIGLHPTDTGCNAVVSYTLTSLGKLGDAALLAFSESWYEEFMRTWERRMNHWLEHGRCLRSRGRPGRIAQRALESAPTASG